MLLRTCPCIYCSGNLQTLWVNTHLFSFLTFLLNIVVVFIVQQQQCGPDTQPRPLHLLFSSTLWLTRCVCDVTAPELSRDVRCSGRYKSRCLCSCPSVRPQCRITAGALGHKTNKLINSKLHTASLTSVPHRRHSTASGESFTCLCGVKALFILRC